MDTLSKERRSEVMAAVRSEGNKSTETKMVAIFRREGIKGWRRRQRIPGKPDFVFRHHHLAIFVDGCFWHGCSKCYRRPSSNQSYWDEKVRKNRERDEQVSESLRLAGWRVLRIWEHQLKDPTAVAEAVRYVASVSAEESDAL